MLSKSILFKDVLYFLNKANVVILLIYLPKVMYNLEKNAFQAKSMCTLLPAGYSGDIIIII